jgi:hypothetical protein
VPALLSRARRGGLVSPRPHWADSYPVNLAACLLAIALPLFLYGV